MDPQLPQTASHKKIILIIVGILLLLIVVSGVAYYFLKVRPKLPEQVQTLPVPVQEGAQFILDANPLESTVGGQIRVSVLVKSDADSANLFVAKLKFPSDLLQAKSIDLKSESTSSGFIKNWFISNWVENTIDNETGSVSLVGGVPNPGFQTQRKSSGSAMADIIFTSKSPGEANISFDDTSSIYRNSDNANILISKKGVTVKILDGTPISSVSATPTPIQSGPLEGDINQDGKVNLQDLSILLSAWGNLSGQSSEADLNKDSLINAFDYSKLTKIINAQQY